MIEIGFLVGVAVFFAVAYQWNKAWVMKQNSGDFSQTRAIWEAMTDQDKMAEFTRSVTEALHKALTQIVLVRTLKMTGIFAVGSIAVYLLVQVIVIGD